MEGPEPRECPEDMRDGFCQCYASDGYMHYWIFGKEVDEATFKRHMTFIIPGGRLDRKLNGQD